MTDKISFRPITEDDMELLFQIYASTRMDELAAVPWEDAEKESFLRMQFHAQHVFYQQNFKEAEYKLVLLDDKPIGRFYVDHRHDEIRVIDIALLPKYRRQGIGSQLMKTVLAKGQQANLPVKIHVEHNNPALHWYTRLGFKQVETHGVYFLMIWKPDHEGG